MKISICECLFSATFGAKKIKPIMNFPAELKYTKDHEWARSEGGGNVRIGITQHAVDQLVAMVRQRERLLPVLARPAAARASDWRGKGKARSSTRGAPRRAAISHW